MEPLVFGLDIGTRNVVGTVGYKEGTEFIVVAQYMKEHETRAMLDGQIHDIGRVAKTIETVKQQLEEQIGSTAYGSLYCCRRSCVKNSDHNGRV